MPPVISIVGRSNSGKTTLLEKIIKELSRRGCRVLAMKHAGEIELDKEGKDSWRFSQAGSEAVVVSSKDSLAIFKKDSRDLGPQELACLVPGNYDIVLAEGFKQSDNLKLEVHRREQGREILSPPEQLLGIVTDEPLEVNKPQFDKEDIESIVDMIENLIQTSAGDKNKVSGRKN